MNIKKENELKSEYINIFKNGEYKLASDTLALLLVDQKKQTNIIWATDNYIKYGSKYEFNHEIDITLIFGKHKNIIQPRINKSIIEKQKRIKEKGEVFTPSWVCNHQNNLIDNVWFDEENVFNIEKEESWESISNKIEFKKKRWQDYILDLRIEITCGEAPYIVSRYDTVSGNYIQIKDRIGVLDRKLRVINENANEKKDWIHWAIKAYQSTYGYEWQGDNLLIARLNLLYTFIEYYEYKFNEVPNVELVNQIADIISWNFWQMDGLKGVIPNSCSDEKIIGYNLFGEPDISSCLGCETQNIFKHNGIYSIIKDWQNDKIIRFVDIL